MAGLISRPTSSSRSTTLLIALLSLTNNTLSSLLIHQLPDDPFHLAVNYGLYLHFANVLSIFGVIGAWRKNPLSVLLFSTYLLLDTLLSSIPRILLLTLLSNSSSILCTPNSSTSLDFSTQSPSSPSPQALTSYSVSSPIPPSTHIAGFSDYMSRPRAGARVGMGMIGSEEGWTESGCRRIISLGYVTLIAGVMATMGLQVLGALYVRDYARGLFAREREREMGGLDMEVERGERGEVDLKVKMVEREGFRPLLVLDRSGGMQGVEVGKLTPILKERDFF